MKEIQPDFLEDGLVKEPLEAEIVEDNEPSTALATQDISPMSLIQSAIINGLEADKLEKLLALQERWDAREERQESRRAEVAYNAAMADCQKELQSVVATHFNKHTESRYADLFDVDTVARPIYTRHGFSLSFGTARSELEKHVHVYCDCRHREGHTCRYADDFPTDNAGINGTVNKTPIQAKGSTTSYAQRYLTKGIFNIVIRGEDNDGNSPGELIGDGELAALEAEFKRLPPPEVADVRLKVLRFAEVETLEAIPKGKFQYVLKKLRATADKFHQ